MRCIAITLIAAACLPAGSLTPAAKAVAAAEAAIQKQPSKAENYNSLALAFTRRARESADPDYYDKAAAAVAKSLELSPDNFEGLKLQAWILLGKHEFADALALATKLRERTGDDEMVYGLLTDAHVELGNYKEAEDAAQWMLNVGRSSIPSLTRAAYLRELLGDIEGALELMYQVFNRLNPGETEERAWTLTQIAHLLIVTGKVEPAGRVLEEALRLVPDYHYALAGLAKVRGAEGKHDESLKLLRRRYELARHPENLFDVGVALRKARKLTESRAVLAQFEREALAESEGSDNANRELVAYYADYAGRADAALRIASREIGRRRDIMTLDAYAWALHKNGRSQEGLKHAEAALAVGTLDPRILYHAGAIAAAAGRHDLAKKYLERSLEVNSRSDVAAAARSLLSRMNARRSAQRTAAGYEIT
jgi:tetratricopeptide (TPR) repeat protein